MALSTSSTKRIERFVDWLIRSEYAEAARESNVSNDYGVDGRFARCMDAAEDGCDGSTHREVIDDYRDAFRNWMQERTRGKFSSYDHFEAAVDAHFDEVEQWHADNGSLDQAIG